MNETGVRKRPQWQQIENPNKNKKHRRKPRLRLEVILALVIILGVIALVAVYGCRTKSITITGSTMYSQEELSEMMISHKYCDNSIYFCLYYDCWYKGDFPFLEAIHVKMTSLTSLEVTVREKEIAGYAALDDTYMYFDTKGMIVLQSSSILPDIPKLDGFDCSGAAVGQSLPIDDSKLLGSVVEVFDDVKAAGLSVSLITFDSKGSIVMESGSVKVAMGQGEYLDEKVRLAAVLLGKLDGKSGTLHLEDYDGTNGNRSFEEN